MVNADNGSLPRHDAVRLPKRSWQEVIDAGHCFPQLHCGDRSCTNSQLEVLMASLRARLERLESLRESFGAPPAREKLELLAELEHKSLGRAADVERLHEALCFSRAWPDNPKLLTTVNRMLKNFSARADLNRFAGALENTGIAGTDIRFPFYRAMAQWLAERCGDSLHLDWQQFENVDRLSTMLENMALFSERGGLRQYLYDAQDWI